MLLSVMIAGLVAMPGCGLDQPVRPMNSTEVASFRQGRYDSRILPASGAEFAEHLTPPVFRLVHSAVEGNDKLTYLAMCSPWYPNSNDRSTRSFDTRFLSRRVTFELDPGKGPVKPGPISGLLGTAAVGEPAMTGGIPMLAQYDSTLFAAVTGTGWIFLTGDRPMVKTRLVVGGSHGTTFIAQIGRIGTTEHHRFALLVPPSDEEATVEFEYASSPGTVVAKITKDAPYVVFSASTSGTGSVTRTGPQAVIGTGEAWDNFQAAIDDAKRKAAAAGLLPDADLPVD